MTLIKKYLPILILADFAALTLWAVVSGGWSGFIEFFSSGNPWVYQVSADLVIALSVASYLIYRDAKTRGISPAPYVALTLTTGSFGPLAYLMKRSSATS